MLFIDIIYLFINWANKDACSLTVIILSLLQTEIICPQNVIEFSTFIFTYGCLSHYLEKCNHTHLFTETVE